MDDKPEVAEHEESAAELRNKLLKRLAVAGGLVAVLLGVLAFFDYLATPPEEPEAPVYANVVPVAPKKPLSQPVTQGVELPEPPATVVAEPPAPPQPAATPAPEEKPDASIVQRPERQAATPAVVGKTPAAPVPVAPTLKPVRPVPESSAAPTVVVPEETVPAPAVKPAARVVDARPVVIAAPSGVSRLFSGFLLQAGVFTSPQRAEELHAKLTLSGVPSTLETRVQVGPFNTRQEAEAAQAKLKELGVESVLVPPKLTKH